MQCSTTDAVVCLLLLNFELPGGRMLEERKNPLQTVQGRKRLTNKGREANYEAQTYQRMYLNGSALL